MLLMLQMLLLACLFFKDVAKTYYKNNNSIQEEVSASPLPNAKYGAYLEGLVRRSSRLLNCHQRLSVNTHTSLPFVKNYFQENPSWIF